METYKHSKDGQLKGREETLNQSEPIVDDAILRWKRKREERKLKELKNGKNTLNDDIDRNYKTVLKNGKKVIHKHDVNDNHDDNDDDNDDNDDINYNNNNNGEEYVPLKRRRKMTIEEIQKKLNKSYQRGGDDNDGDNVDNDNDDNDGNGGNGSNGVNDNFMNDNMNQNGSNFSGKKDQVIAGPKSKMSLINYVQELERIKPRATEEEKMKQMEEKLLSNTAKAPLIPVKQRAKGMTISESVETSWKPPKYISEMSVQMAEKIRKKYHILVDGEDIPPPIPSFSMMKLPIAVLNALKEKNIHSPTPIQMQALPPLLSGRDTIGIAFTGSGKTITFVLPMVLQSLEEELKMPIISGEGPFGLILCPSRELARQTFEITENLLKYFRADGFPELKPLLLIGGTPIKEQEMQCRRGVHMIVATPGRLLHMLKHHIFDLNDCRYICLDEADRLVDTTFEEDIREIFDFFKIQKRQTVLFSATMPEKIRAFAKQSLVRPVVVNVGRAGAANLDVVQEVEYVKPENKIVYLLECLQKTPPPVLIFCENKQDVDDIHQYLLLKGVAAVSIHGGKEQEDREQSIKLFKEGKKDVLVATDVCSKGLDFPDIQHVINYDMPKVIEDYVHRIGRTGRCGKTGLASTFINNTQQSESILLDLKYLLMEAKQRIPPILQSLNDPLEMANNDKSKGCKYCGGLGHRITNCPKRERERNEEIRQKMGISMLPGY